MECLYINGTIRYFFNIQMLYYEMALRCWTELELKLSAQLKRVGWEHFHRSNKARGSSVCCVGLCRFVWLRC